MKCDEDRGGERDASRMGKGGSWFSKLKRGSGKLVVRVSVCWRYENRAGVGWRRDQDGLRADG